MSIRPQAPPQPRTLNLVQRRPLTCFFTLTYVAAWSLWIPLAGLRDRLPGALELLLALVGSMAPSMVAILLIAILQGRRGVRKLFGARASSSG